MGVKEGAIGTSGRLHWSQPWLNLTTATSHYWRAQLRADRCFDSRPAADGLSKDHFSTSFSIPAFLRPLGLEAFS